MIKLGKANNIEITHGDTLIVEYDMDQELTEEDVITFAIRERDDEGLVVLQQQMAGDGTNKLQVVVSSEDMAKIAAGKYIYDLSIQYANGIRYTTDFPYPLTIVPAAHEVM